MTGSSINGLGCRSSDADLCLVITGKVSLYCSVVFVSTKCKTVDAHLFLNFSSLFFIYFRKGLILFQSLINSEVHLEPSVSVKKLFWQSCFLKHAVIFFHCQNTIVSYFFLLCTSYKGIKGKNYCICYLCTRPTIQAH